MHRRDSNGDRHGDKHADGLPEPDKYGDADCDEHRNKHGNEYADRHTYSIERSLNNGKSVERCNECQSADRLPDGEIHLLPLISSR